MKTILLMLGAFAGYILAYRTYGRFLARRIFRLRADAVVPARAFEDGVDFVPTKKEIIFGHHYTSIAGTGPIVGPAIGVIWGWLPALLWVLLGSIFVGAVHDFGTLILSLRNEGKSLSEVAAKYIGPRVRYIFFMVVFLVLLIVIAIFGLIIALIFKIFPSAVLPVWLQIPIAIGMGRAVYKRKAKVLPATLLAVLAMYGTVVAGHWLPLELPDLRGMPATGSWTLILLVYAFVASTLPVTTLLQPRDYINAWQLVVAMALMVMGVLAAGTLGKLHIVAPAFNPAPEGAPAMYPFLFITIACGAVSGFHSLVSSGTSSKQVAREPDALFVAYGSMLLEGALAVLVLCAVAAGIGMAYEHEGITLTGVAAWNQHYASWAASQGLASNIKAVVIGAANMISTLGVPKALGIVIMGVFIASFAGTTLDTATRIQRYVVAELFGGTRLKFMTGRYPATVFAVGTAAALAFGTGADGAGALKLWPMFGAVNQLLAAVGLLLVTLYLRREGHGWLCLVSGVPFVVMLAITMCAVGLNQKSFVVGKQWLLAGVNGILIILVVWTVIEGVVALAARRGDG